MALVSDIVVVGAGIVGCAAAFELARRGASVQIVDDRPAGSGATQASAGVLAPYIEAREDEALLRLGARSLALYDEFVDRAAATSGVAVEYQRTGTIDIATSEDGYTRLKDAAAALQARGIAAQLLDASAARELEPQLSADAIGGLFVESHGFVAAADLTRALGNAARRHGAQLIERGRVHRISASGRDLIVETDRGPLRGDGVVVAAGSWSGQIDVAGAARVPVKPIRGQLLQLGWCGDRLARTLWGERCYMVPWSNGTVLVGATVEDAGFDERTTVAGVRDLVDAACELVPQTWSASFTSARVGLRPATADHLPVIGFSNVTSNVMYATGHYRNGILLAPLTARLVADAMLDGRRDPLLDLTAPSRFGAL